MEFLLWLRDTGYVTWVRESTSLLGYTLYLALHTIGLVLLVGPNMLIASRISFRLKPESLPTATPDPMPPNVPWVWTPTLTL